MQYNIEAIAKMIDHSLLHPTMTDEDLEKGVQQAIYYKTASVCIKPYAVPQCAAWLNGTGVLVCTVIGFPHGSHTTVIKVAETKLACEQGCDEIDMVVNIGKVLSGDWTYVADEIRAINDECLKHGAILKVIFENDYLKDEHKIKLCQICSEIPVAFVKTSTGYGYVKGDDGKFSTKGATLEDVALMLKHVAPGVQVKAAGGVRSLDELMKMKELGVTRIGATATAAIVEEARKRNGLTSAEVSSTDKSGY
ncbi:MAG: deoxyribose-phosphate aldolase [Sphingobacteriales bacterium]|jgi:deoxyribose-phosphate aldolase